MQQSQESDVNRVLDPHFRFKIRGAKRLVLKPMPSYALCSRPLSDPSNTVLLRIKGPFDPSRRCNRENNLLREKKLREEKLVRAKLGKQREE